MERPVKKVFFLENMKMEPQFDPQSSFYLSELRGKGARLRFDAPNKKIFRDLRTLTVKDFKNSPISRGRDHWDLEKWRT